MGVEGGVSNGLWGLELEDLLSEEWVSLWGSLHEGGGGWGKVTGGVGLLVGVAGWLWFDAWGSDWSVLWSVGTGAGLLFAVDGLSSVGSSASWELLVWGVNDDWVPFSLVSNINGLSIGESGDETGLGESRGSWHLSGEGWGGVEGWGIVELNVADLLGLVVVWLSLHSDVLTEVLITVHAGGEVLSVWDALDSLDLGLDARGEKLNKSGGGWMLLVPGWLVEVWVSIAKSNS